MQNTRPSHEELNELEQIFIQETGESKGYTILHNPRKVMISAPHSVNHTRNNQPKTGEYRTGVIALLLHKTIQTPVIYKTKNLSDDANRDKPCAYKQALAQYIKEQKVQFLIDLHICAPRRPLAIELGTGSNFNLNNNPQMLDSISTILALRHNPIIVDKHFNPTHRGNVCKYINMETLTPSLQIEVNWNELNTWEKTLKFVETLTLLIEHIEETYFTY